MLALHAVRYRLASDSLNSVELVQRLLPQIEASQPTLHAFTVVLAESALAENSEPLLVSLACQLTALTGYTRHQPASVSE